MRVTITDIVDEPGATRPLHVEVDRDEFGDASWGPADELMHGTIGLDLKLDAVVDGILVRGTVGVDLDLACARCLAACSRHLNVEVAELFSHPDRVELEDEIEAGYEILDAGTAIDLTTLVRDALLIDLPLRVLCRDDCAGLCPSCGADRNARDCGHTGRSGTDPRWAALAEVRLPPE